jgi:hypothetical protein
VWGSLYLTTVQWSGVLLGLVPAWVLSGHSGRMLETTIEIYAPIEKGHLSWCSVFPTIPHPLLEFNINPTDWGRIDAKGKVVLLWREKKMSGPSKVDGSDSYL